LEDTTLQINLGAVSSICGKLSFSFVVHSSGEASLHLYASDPSDGRRSGVLVQLDAAEYAKLKQLVQKTDETIEKLRSAGQMKSMMIRQY
jgi:hypothetical protein